MRKTSKRKRRSKMNLQFWRKRKPDSRPPGPYFRMPVIVSDAQQKRADLERLLALAGVSDSNPIWKTVLSYIDEHARTEQEFALGPDLPDSVRQYNAGRAASALDLAMALRDLKVQANLQAKKIEGKKEA